MRGRAQIMVNDLLLGADEPPAFCMALYPDTEYAGAKGHRLVMNNGTSYQSATVESPEDIKALLCSEVDRVFGGKG